MISLCQALMEMVFSVMLYNTGKTKTLDAVHESMKIFLQCVKIYVKDGKIEEKDVDSYYAFIGHAYSFLDT